MTKSATDDWFLALETMLAASAGKSIALAFDKLFLMLARVGSFPAFRLCADNNPTASANPVESMQRLVFINNLFRILSKAGVLSSLFAFLFSLFFRFNLHFSDSREPFFRRRKAALLPLLLAMIPSSSRKGARAGQLWRLFLPLMSEGSLSA